MTKNPITKGLPPIHPGAILREETLPGLVHADTGEKVKKIEFAAALGITRQALDLILNEQRPVSIETSIRLAAVLGTSPDVWINLQTNYDLAKAAARIDTSTLPLFKQAA